MLFSRIGGVPGGSLGNLRRARCWPRRVGGAQQTGVSDGTRAGTDWARVHVAPSLSPPGLLVHDGESFCGRGLTGVGAQGPHRACERQVKGVGQTRPGPCLDPGHRAWEGGRQVQPGTCRDGLGVSSSGSQSCRGPSLAGPTCRSPLCSPASVSPSRTRSSPHNESQVHERGKCEDAEKDTSAWSPGLPAVFTSTALPPRQGTDLQCLGTVCIRGAH